MPRPDRLSYIFIFAMLVLVAALHLATPFIAVLFAYFALSKLDHFQRKRLTVLLFVILVLAIFYGFGWFIRRAIKAVPEIASTSVPLIIDYAKAHNFDLPFE